MKVWVAAAAVCASRLLPRERVRPALTKGMYSVGVAVTLGASKSPTFGPVWNKTVEPLLVDAIEDVTHAVHHGFVQGLRSDN